MYFNTSAFPLLCSLYLLVFHTDVFLTAPTTSLLSISLCLYTLALLFLTPLHITIAFPWLSTFIYFFFKYSVHLFWQLLSSLAFSNFILHFLSSTISSYFLFFLFVSCTIFCFLCTFRLYFYPNLYPPSFSLPSVNSFCIPSLLNIL